MHTPMQLERYTLMSQILRAPSPLAGPGRRARGGGYSRPQNLNQYSRLQSGVAVRFSIYRAAAHNVQ